MASAYEVLRLLGARSGDQPARRPCLNSANLKIFVLQQSCGSK